MWASELQTLGLSKKELEEMADEAAADVLAKESDVKVLRKEASTLQNQQSHARSNDKTQTGSYGKCSSGKGALATGTLVKAAESEEKQRKGKSKDIKDSKSSLANDSVPTWKWPMAED
ncbi:hypothetical protein BGZ65_007988 [Modicella reniformis]|uniref:Uncharacterized protein n=1 Tax=Modicella reniformis TaxID=1440133 RepID=A0A9P6J4S7_9FUNG|nr:hypothetical protein BGZ65_007988 [Modicella reniformis]